MQEKVLGKKLDSKKQIAILGLSSLYANNNKLHYREAYCMHDYFNIGGNREQQLGNLLTLIAEDLDIPEDLKAGLVLKYNHLGSWIRKDNEDRYRTESEIYPQGSVRLGTSIQPVTLECGYDVDIVYLRRLSKNSISQEQLVEQAGEQLKRYIEFRRLEGKEVPELVRRRRCWAMNYPGRFHMDVLPALPDDDGTLFTRSMETSILLTDRQLWQWQYSNPKAYAEWFRECEILAFTEKRISMARAGNVEVEQIADDAVKTPLRVSVQILKRHRDVRYSGNPDDKPISIIITTLAAAAYRNERELFDALMGIITRMETSIEMIDGKWWIPNPVNPKENFADKWNQFPQRAQRFFEWLAAVKADLEALLQLSGLNNISSSLSASFGSDVVERSMKKFGDGVDASQQRGDLRMAVGTGMLNMSTGTKVVKNTWYGN
ncbi:MAG: nucleotidyltransferase [Acidobacteria bacterium]|nr:nucleotidyltransferase [Acidobacteriota bacterium]